MQAIQILETGGPEVLQFNTVADPTPAAGEALIRIEASGVNFIDTYFREGRYPAQLPYTLGVEAAGVVVAVQRRDSSSCRMQSLRSKRRPRCCRV